MGKRLFWFAIGVGLTAVVVVKGREYYQRYTPKGVAESLEKGRTGLVDWVGDFISTLGDAMNAREGELREALGLDE